MCRTAAAPVLLLVLALAAPVVHAGSEGGFMQHRHAGSSSSQDFLAAMGTVMGCGGGVQSDRLEVIEKVLVPMWGVLPKNQHGLAEWRMVRYLVHRYFMQQSSLLVRGFEPMRQINASDLGAPGLLGDHMDSLGKSLESKHSSDGFSLKEAVTMVATLEELMRHSESALLEKVYKQMRFSPHESELDVHQVEDLAETYFVNWMLEGDEQTVRVLLRNRTLLETAFPKWHDVKTFIQGTVKSLQYSRQRVPQRGQAASAFEEVYTFDDVHEVVSDFTRRFASFWESECQIIKDSLVGLDKTGTGRIRLSDFYGANADGEWRFGESEAYLRELGALDESSSWAGKQVIIPNYLQGASNCIVTTANYLVCCQNECEGVLNEIEDAVGAPVAQPEEILSLVSDMSGLDDVPPTITKTLRTQLTRIAETHGGSVPLHGRLFAQWLHYVFPRECPFPHKTGMTTAMTPTEYGDNFIASDAEVTGHAAARNGSISLLGEIDEAQHLSQWSEEEELIADYSKVLRAPWNSSGLAFGSIIVLALLLFAAGAGVSKGSGKASSAHGASAWGAFESKAHFV